MYIHENGINGSHAGNYYVCFVHSSSATSTFQRELKYWQLALQQFEA
jgi:hypothetical protein